MTALQSISLRYRAVALLPPLGGAVALNLPNFLYPFFEDTALFAAFGRWMHQGLLPYRDLVEQKPPAIYWIAYITHLAFGDSPVAYRLTELLCILLLALGCAFIADQILPGARGWSVLIAAALCSGSFWRLPERGQVEFFQAAAMTWSVLWALIGLRNASGKPYFLSGLFLGVATWFKPQAILLAVPTCIAFGLAAVHAQRPKSAYAKRVLYFAAGGLCSSLPFLAWLVATESLEPFLQTVALVRGGYLGLRSQPGLWLTLSQLEPVGIPALTRNAIVLFSALGFAALFRSKDAGPSRWANAVLLGGWILSAAGQFALGRFLFNYHKIILIPAVAVLTAVGSWWAVTAITKQAGRLVPSRAGFLRFGLALSAFSLVGLTPKLALEFADLCRLPFSGHRTEIWCAYGIERHYFNYCQQEQVGKYLRSNSSEHSRVQLISLGSVAFLASGRPPATRYPIAAIALDKRLPGHEQRLQEFVEGLTDRRTSYVVVRFNDYFPWFGLKPGYAQVEDLPPLKRALVEHFEAEGEIVPGYFAFRRSQVPATPAHGATFADPAIGQPRETP